MYIYELEKVGEKCQVKRERFEIGRNKKGACGDTKLNSFVSLRRSREECEYKNTLHMQKLWTKTNQRDFVPSFQLSLSLYQHISQSNRKKRLSFIPRTICFTTQAKWCVLKLSTCLFLSTHSHYPHNFSGEVKERNLSRAKITKRHSGGQSVIFCRV